MKGAVEARRAATFRWMKEIEDPDKSHAMWLEEERSWHKRDRKNMRGSKTNRKNSE